MSNPGSTIPLGGVTYNPVLFTGEKLKNGKFKLTAKKTGETIIFEQQPHNESRHPRIELKSSEAMLYSHNCFNITDIMGATFSSSKKATSSVTLTDCNYSTVDLAANNSLLFGDRAIITGGKGNQAILDKNDIAKIDENDYEEGKKAIYQTTNDEN